jgi:hypothetical protein
LATSAAPTVPPAPARLSTTMEVPSAGPSFSASRRATTSVPLPAVNGTTSLIGLPARPLRLREHALRGQERGAGEQEGVAALHRESGHSVLQGTDAGRPVYFRFRSSPPM